MTGQAPPLAFLRHTAPNALGKPDLHPLAAEAEVLIGRDPLCAIFFESSAATSGISRQHAKVCHAAYTGWQICDLNSANGTYVNGRRVQGCQVLQHGDRVTLGQGEPQLIFELQPVQPPAAASHTAIAPAPAAADSVTFSQLFPIASTGNDLARKAFLIPGIVTVLWVVLLFLSIGNSETFNFLLASYLVGVSYFFVYRLCGKPKPAWLLMGAAAFTALVLSSPLLDLFIRVFRQTLPGSVPSDFQSISFPVLLVRMFFGAGLMEELIKALPVLLLAVVGKLVKRSLLREQIGVWEPLDGILLGTASAVGFTLMETLGQYVPGIVSQMPDEQLGELRGLQLLIPRILGVVSGHMAYSGYLGYFIGLSMLKPRGRWRILSVGYLSSAALHALWNATGVINVGVLVLVGILSYAFLAAAILKARALSPNRSQNFATRLTRLR